MKLVVKKYNGKVFLKNSFFDEPKVLEALEQVLDKALFSRDSRPYAKSGGGIAGWAYDFRIPMLTSGPFNIVLEHTAKYLQSLNYSTIGLKGYGAIPFLGLLQYPGIDNVLIARETRKHYGFKAEIEGSADIQKPVCMIDDIANSGGSMLRAHTVFAKYNYNVNKYLCFISFGWGQKKVNTSMLDPILEIVK